MDDEPYDLLEPTVENFPFKTIEPVLDWMLEMHPFEIAHFAREEGYTCANMKNPEQAVEWMNFAIMEESEWRDLPVGAVRFWKAFYQKWRMWQMKNGKLK